MKNFVERFRWQDIERSAGDDVASYMLRTWLENNGIITEDLLPITTKLIILGQPRVADQPPDILLCGNDALATKFFGANWSDCPELALEIMGDEYKKLVASAYHDAEQSCEPVFDLVSTEYDQFSLKYQRLILPFVTRSGLKFQYVYSMPLGNLPVTLRIPSGKLPLSGMTQSTSLYSPVALADQ